MMSSHLSSGKVSTGDTCWMPALLLWGDGVGVGCGTGVRGVRGVRGAWLAALFGKTPQNAHHRMSTPGAGSSSTGRGWGVRPSVHPAAACDQCKGQPQGARTPHAIPLQAQPAAAPAPPLTAELVRHRVHQPLDLARLPQVGVGVEHVDLVLRAQRVLGAGGSKLGRCCAAAGRPPRCSQTQHVRAACARMRGACSARRMQLAARRDNRARARAPLPRAGAR
jgi:hypothetical protein